MTLRLCKKQLPISRTDIIKRSGYTELLSLSLADFKILNSIFWFTVFSLPANSLAISLVYLQLYFFYILQMNLGRPIFCI